MSAASVLPDRELPTMVRKAVAALVLLTMIITDCAPVAGSAAHHAQATAARPNIILILADDLG